MSLPEAPFPPLFSLKLLSNHSENGLYLAYGTCKSTTTYPRPRAFAAIKNHKDWFAHQELVKARDVHVKN